MKRITYLAFASLAVLTGCGGGSGSSGSGGSSTTTSAPGQTAVLGHATIKYTGKIQSNVNANTGNISVVGAAGASFSELNYLPASILANSTLIYWDGVGKAWTYSNGVQAQFGTSVAGLANYSFTHDGHVLLAMLDSTGYNQIYECYYDGSGLTKITSNAEDHESVSANPTNTAFLYSNGSTLKSCNFTGGAVTTVGEGVLGEYSPDGTKIALLSTGFQPYLMSSTPGSTQTAFDTSLVGDNTTDISIGWSADNAKIAFSMGGSCYVCESSNDEIFTAVAGGSGFDRQPTIGPDNATIAFERSSASGSPSSIVTSGLDGNNPSTIAYPGTGFSYVYPVWSPFLGPRSFVGSGGSMFTSASGFLWAEKGSGFTSLASYTATTPADATITAETTSGSYTSVVFDLHADKITSLKYTNSYYVPATTISPNVSDTLLSFDEVTGQVTTAIPYAVVKSVKPTRKVVGTVATYTGHFLGVYNNKGKNLATNGASSVSLDLKTGSLVAWH